MMALPTLSPRLQALFDGLLPGEPVWDVCCDHGYLGIAALRSGNFPEVHFVDQVPSIIRNLQERLFKSKYPEKIFFHAMDANTFQAPVGGNLVIAGIGGVNMIQILQRLNSLDLLKVQRLILCAHRDDDKLKEWLLCLAAKGPFNFIAEQVVTERGRSRRVFVLKSDHESNKFHKL